MHFQTTVSNWTRPLVKMPDGALLKSVNDPAILIDGMAKWTAAGRDPRKLFTDFRHHDFFYPDFDKVEYTWEEFKDIWRGNFRKFVDATYLQHYAEHVRLVEELNEYTDTRMVTDKALLKPRLASASAAAWVWNNEYRGRTIEVDGVEGHIPSNCRLVLCNSPIGNDVPKEYYRLSVDEDAPLGVHPYTHWVNKQRDPLDFRWHSGRWHYNEQAYGIRPDYVFTECGPYGNTIAGWRHDEVMGGSLELLKQGMLAWWQDCQQTAAYQEGRILGPGAWFTSSRSDDQWDYYRLWESELEPLAEIAAEVWHPGTPAPKPPIPPIPPPEPPPDPPTPEPTDNLLVNGSFEGGWYHPNNISELQIPDDWTFEYATEETPNPVDSNPWSEFVRPEVRVLSKNELPPDEHGLFIVDGEQTVKVFKDSGSVWFKFSQELSITPGDFELQLHVFADLVKGYTTGGDKIWADDPEGLDGQIRVRIDGETVLDWLSLTPGEMNVIAVQFEADGPGALGVEIMCPYPLKNNGVFLDDWQLIPATVTPPPEPPDPEPICRGLPREGYAREYWVLAADMTELQINAVIDLAKKGKKTVGWSYDDAGIGDLDNRKAVLWNLEGAETQAEFMSWFREYYPGVVVEFRTMT